MQINGKTYINIYNKYAIYEYIQKKCIFKYTTNMQSINIYNNIKIYANKNKYKDIQQIYNISMYTKEMYI